MSAPPSGERPGDESDGAVVVRRLHRMVRHGYVPLLGHDAANGGDRDIRLHRRGAQATLGRDGTLTLTRPGRGAAGNGATVVAGGDAASFDALFPPGAPNKRNVVRRLYEMGLGS